TSLTERVSAGMLKIEVEQCFAMDKVADAHVKVANGHARGKILLDMQV
ncbi:MAG TPA: NADPH:quinone reductase, partial [Vibrio sp.]|nr:NADPH:quinone reductase [Vibrio sp.]